MGASVALIRFCIRPSAAFRVIPKGQGYDRNISVAPLFCSRAR